MEVDVACHLSPVNNFGGTLTFALDRKEQFSSAFLLNFCTPLPQSVKKKTLQRS